MVCSIDLDGSLACDSAIPTRRRRFVTSSSAAVARSAARFAATERQGRDLHHAHHVTRCHLGRDMMV